MNLSIEPGFYYAIFEIEEIVFVMKSDNKGNDVMLPERYDSVEEAEEMLIAVTEKYQSTIH